MNLHQPGTNKQLYYRLVALWVICEAFAGGIMHGLKLPFTGLIVSSLAITCIILIAYHIPSRTAIISATVTVAIFKLMLSPHSPPTAYIAVFFQGATGQMLLGSKKHFRTGAIILAMAALLESALQRLIVLVIIYGNNLWLALNMFIQKITGDHSTTNYSLLMAAGYVIIHGITGLFVGMYAVRLARSSDQWAQEHPEFVFEIPEEMPSGVFPAQRRRRLLKPVLLVTWFVLLLLLIQSILQPGNPILPKNIITGLILRSFIIIIGWYLLFGPLLMKFLNKALETKKLSQQEDIREVMQLLPHTRYIFKKSLQVAANERGTRRINLFLKVLLLNVLRN